MNDVDMDLLKDSVLSRVKIAARLDANRMERCGEAEHRAWANGVKWITDTLGPYQQTTPMVFVNRRLGHDLLTNESLDAYERGWQRFGQSRIAND